MAKRKAKACVRQRHQFAIDRLGHDQWRRLCVMDADSIEEVWAVLEKVNMPQQSNGEIFRVTQR